MEQFFSLMEYHFEGTKLTFILFYYNLLIYLCKINKKIWIIIHFFFHKYKLNLKSYFWGIIFRIDILIFFLKYSTLQFVNIFRKIKMEILYKLSSQETKYGHSEFR